MSDLRDREYTQRWLPGVPVEYVALGVGGPKVRYIRVGQGPALVLMHTVRTQLDIFQRVIPKLAQHFTVYAFDYPGFGWSEIVPGGDYREPAFRQHVVNFVERLNLRDVTLAGESMGATLALTAASALGNRVTRVVAFNTYDYFPGLERANFLAWFIIKWVRAPFVGPVFAALENRMILKGIMSGGVYDPSTLPPDFIDELDRVGKRKGYSKVARAVYKSLSSYVAAKALYGKLKVPVVMVYGDHDWSRPSDRSASIAKIPGAAQVELLNTGHFASMEDPDQFAQILIDSKSVSGD
ncbi:MAG: alpha/beta hydrolase [Acidobacteriaceae bacterium]|nr:alpha/beta hydrolase [Acidobacteriaceae bacterium]